MEKSLKDSSWEFFQNYMDQISDNKIHSKLCQSASGPYIFMWRKGCLDFKYTPAFFLVKISGNFIYSQTLKRLYLLCR